MNLLKSLPALALGFAVCGVASAQSLQVDSDLGQMVYQYLTQKSQQQLSQRQQQIAALSDKASVLQRQAYIRKTILEELGGFPAKTPLHPQITGTLDGDGFRVEKLVYQSLPHFYVTADVYVPKTGHAPYPTVLGVAGHSQDGKESHDYQNVWIALARRGFLVMAIDPVGQGERIEHLDPVTHRPMLRPNGTMEHMTDGMQALLTGTEIARYLIWDGIRGVDYLQSRPDVDKSRIAVAGNSGGGTQSAYIATMDTRIAAAVISCYLTSWRSMWDGPGPQDSEQVFTGFLADHLDFGDFLIAIGPRPVLMETATHDFFPIEGAHQTYQEAKRVFGLMGASQKLNYFEAPDNHGWTAPRRAAAFKFLSHWFQHGSETTVSDQPVHFDSATQLNATPTGQVLTTYPDATTVQAMTADQAERLRAQAKAHPKSRAQLAVLVRKRLSLPAQIATPAADVVGTVDRDGMRVEKVKIHSEPGIIVPGLVFTPAQGPARKPAVLYLNPAGMAAGAAPGGPIEQLVRQGNVVLSIDPRGWGESAPPKTWASGYPSDYQIPMRAILTGKAMPAMQAFDVLSAYRYLASRPGIQAGAISLHSTGKATNLALFAATVEPKIHAVVSEQAPMTYLAMAQLKLNKVDPDVILPGVLRDFDLPDLEHALGSRFRVEGAAAQPAAGQ